MSLSPTHGRRSKLERKQIENGKPLQNRMKNELKYNKSDALVELVYIDIANGKSRSDCIQKLMEGMYTDYNYSRRQAETYYRAALERFAVDTDVEMEKLRNVFYTRYLSLYEEAVKKGDIFNAKGVLDSMSKIFGIEQKTPQNAIQINGGDDKIVINFGLDASTVQD